MISYQLLELGGGLFRGSLWTSLFLPGNLSGQNLTTCTAQSLNPLVCVCVCLFWGRGKGGVRCARLQGYPKWKGCHQLDESWTSNDYLPYMQHCYACWQCNMALLSGWKNLFSGRLTWWIINQHHPSSLFYPCFCLSLSWFQLRSQLNFVHYSSRTQSSIGHCCKSE